MKFYFRSVFTNISIVGNNQSNPCGIKTDQMPFVVTSNYRFYRQRGYIIWVFIKNIDT